MGKKKWLRVSDIAQEAGLTESEAIQRLRRSGIRAFKGCYISIGDLQRVRGILSGASNEVGVSKRNVAEVESTADELVSIYDAVDSWLCRNPVPKHLRVAGRTYDDFVRSCYQFLLVYALRHGAPSTGIMVGSEDRQQIEDF